eukprot:jgi/Hompol1/2921/HPOL_006232-RA
MSGLSLEILKTIYEFTGILTQFLHGPLTWERALIHSESMKAAIVRLPELQIQSTTSTGIDLLRASSSSSLSASSELAGTADTIATYSKQHALHERQIHDANLACRQASRNVLALFLRHHQPGIGDPSKVALMLTAAAGAGRSDIGDLESVKRICTQFSDSYQTCSISHTIKSKHNDMLVWLLENTPLATHERCRVLQLYCVNYHNLKLLLYLREHSIGASLEQLVTESASLADADYAWIDSNVVPFEWPSIDTAAIRGNLGLLKWLHRQPTSQCTPNTMDYAAMHGHLEIVKYLDQHHTEGCTKTAFDQAYLRGHRSVALYLLAHRQEGCTFPTMDTVAARGDLDMLKLLHAHPNATCSSAAMDLAAEYGRLEVVQWLHHNRTEGCTPLAVDQALAYKHYDVVKFLLRHRTE